MPTRFSGSAADSRTVSPSRARFLISRSRPTASGCANCSPLNPLHEPPAGHRAARFHPAERPQHFPPRHRDVLPGQQVPEHHAPPDGQLLRDRLGQLVGVAVRQRRGQQRPPARRPGGELAAAAQPVPPERRGRQRALREQGPHGPEAVRGEQPPGHAVPQRVLDLARQPPGRGGQVGLEQRAPLGQRVEHVPGPAGPGPGRRRRPAGRGQQPGQVVAEHQRDRRRPGRRQPPAGQLALGTSPEVSDRSDSRPQATPPSRPTSSSHSLR